MLFCIFIDALLHSHFVHQTTDIFSICRNFGRIRLRFKARLVIADPMQYLLNPIGKIRKVRSISRTGECTNPSQLQIGGLVSGIYCVQLRLDNRVQIQKVIVRE